MEMNETHSKVSTHDVDVVLAPPPDVLRSRRTRSRIALLSFTGMMIVGFFVIF